MPFYNSNGFITKLVKKMIRKKEIPFRHRKWNRTKILQCQCQTKMMTCLMECIIIFRALTTMISVVEWSTVVVPWWCRWWRWCRWWTTTVAQSRHQWMEKMLGQWWNFAIFLVRWSQWGTWESFARWKWSQRT